MNWEMFFIYFGLMAAILGAIWLTAWASIEFGDWVMVAFIMTLTLATAIFVGLVV